MKREPPDIEKIARGRIKQLRKEQGLTQEELAERADLTAEAVTRVERGARTPTLKTLGKLAHGLGVSPGELVDVEATDPPKLSRHLAKIVSKLEDEDPSVQESAAELVVTFLRGVSRIGDARP